jgi:hypothetical protein
VYRSHDEIGPPLLGIHRPALTQEALKRLGPDQAVATGERTRVAVENYLKLMGVPAKYVDNMYSVPPGRVLWIRNDEFEADFQGLIPEEKIWVDAKCDTFTAEEEKTWLARRDKDQALQSAAERSMTDLLTKKHEGQLKCEENAQAELALSAYNDIRKKTDSELPVWMRDSTPSAAAK